MNVRSIVGQAWQMTQEHFRKLFWYGFTPAFFGVMVSSAYLTYQYNAIRTSPLFSSEQRDIWATYDIFKELFSDHTTFFIVVLIVAALIFLGNILLKPIFTGTLITALMRLHRKESVEGSVEMGVRKFFPIFEFGIITGSFSITTLFTESSFILRWWGQGALFAALPILLFIAMAGLIINFLFTYSEYYIVLENKKLTKAMMESSILVIANLKKTILVLVLMLLIGARIILNVILVLLIPMLVVFLTTYLATIFLSTFGMILIGAIVLAILILSAYLLGLFQVFATAVWVLTFDHLLQKGQKPDTEGGVDDGQTSQVEAPKEPELPHVVGI